MKDRVESFIASVRDLAFREGVTGYLVVWPAGTLAFEIGAGEWEHYLASMLFEGFYASVRLVETEEKRSLELQFWEYGDGDPDLSESRLAFMGNVIAG